jgi:uncharacterized membrane protein YtjA (UPF0391 family)
MKNIVITLVASALAFGTFAASANAAPAKTGYTIRCIASILMGK